MAETTATHFPITWREPLEDLRTTDTFFDVLLLPQLQENTALAVLDCLNELASCRPSLFTDHIK